MRAELQNTLERYLRVFPAEREQQRRFADQLATDAGDIFSRKNMNGHVTSSALVLSPAEDAVLCIHHKAYDFWFPNPGGHYEAPGNLWDSAQREVAEETGVTGLALHRWHQASAIPLDIHTHNIPARPEKNEGPHPHHDFLYLALAPAGTKLQRQEEEIKGIRWTPLAELSAMPGQRLADRLLPKLRSLGLV